MTKLLLLYKPALYQVCFTLYQYLYQVLRKVISHGNGKLKTMEASERENLEIKGIITHD